MIIKIDDREPELQLLADLNNMDIEFERVRLYTGDFVFGNLLIERKEIDDFCSSILDKRIEGQVVKMKESGMDCYVIVVGNMKDRKIGIHENCILGKCVSLVHNHGMKLLWCEDEFQFLYLLKNLCMKYEKEVMENGNKT